MRPRPIFHLISILGLAMANENIETLISNLLFRNVKKPKPSFSKTGFASPSDESATQKAFWTDGHLNCLFPFQGWGAWHCFSHIWCRSLFHHMAACKLSILFCHVRPPSPPHPLTNWHRNEVNWRVNIVESSISLLTHSLTLHHHLVHPDQPLTKTLTRTLTRIDGRGRKSGQFCTLARFHCEIWRRPLEVS